MIPIFAVRAYRVVDAAPYGWYFLGRVPLSRVARLWNLLLLLGVPTIVAGFFLVKHYNSPAALAQRRLDEAGRLAEAGDLRGAAESYKLVLSTAPDFGPQALEGLGGLLDHPGSDEDVAGVFV